MILPLRLLLAWRPWAGIIFIANVHDLALLGGELRKKTDQKRNKNKKNIN